jgi:RimJ/RimL family protein N-acetyltransferase
VRQYYAWAAASTARDAVLHLHTRVAQHIANRRGFALSRRLGAEVLRRRALAASAQRTRCNTETKYLLLRHAFEVWDVHRVAFRTDVRNEMSRVAIERLGAKLEGIRRADKPGRDGTVRDSIFFSIVRGEWPAVRAALERRLA